MNKAARSWPSARCWPPAPRWRRKKPSLNVYNWSDYIAEDTDRQVRGGDRHQGQLRRVRQQRAGRGQAPRRQLGLRRRRALGLLPRAPGRRRPVPAARQVQAPQPRQHGPRRHGGDRRARSGQRARRRLHVGHHRHRLQRRQGQPSALGDAPLDSWDMVFKPEIVAKLADCGVTLLDAPAEIMAIGAQLSRPRSRTRRATRTSPRPRTC